MASKSSTDKIAAAIATLQAASDNAAVRTALTAAGIVPASVARGGQRSASADVALGRKLRAAWDSARKAGTVPELAWTLDMSSTNVRPYWLAVAFTTGFSTDADLAHKVRSMQAADNRAIGGSIRVLKDAASNNAATRQIVCGKVLAERYILKQAADGMYRLVPVGYSQAEKAAAKQASSAKQAAPAAPSKAPKQASGSGPVRIVRQADAKLTQAEKAAANAATLQAELDVLAKLNAEAELAAQ